MVKRNKLQKWRLRKHASNLTEAKRLKVISYQITLIKNSLRSFVYFRELDRLVKADDYFCKATKFAHFQLFVTGWCMCFGQKRTESTHWRFSSSGHSEFKRKLFYELNIGGREFSEYVKSMLAVRNKLLSHTDINVEILSIPNFDTALSAQIYLYNYLKGELLKIPQVLHIEVLSIETWLDNLHDEAGSIVESTHAATQKLPQYH